MPLHDFLKKKRLERGLSQQAVADHAGVKREYYCMIESCKRRPSPDVAQKIADICDFDWTIFFTPKCCNMKHKEGRCNK